jgi:hypothetical protein
MAEDGAVLDLCGSFPDGDGIDDLTARLSANSGLNAVLYQVPSKSSRIWLMASASTIEEMLLDITLSIQENPATSFPVSNHRPLLKTILEATVSLTQIWPGLVSRRLCK